MVKSDYINKTKISPKRVVFLAIILGVIANFLFGNIVFAQKFELTSKDVERIKTGLGLIKTFGNIVIGDDKLKTILNTTIKGGEVSTDLTYGLLVLSAFNEMELIDMVVSGRYSIEATKYFNQIIDERTNLISYWKGVGFDLPKILSGGVPGPMSALTLNSFAMSNNIMMIIIEVRNIMLVQMYDGLWRYFDERRGNSSHEGAWGAAKDAMGWMTDTKNIEYLKSLPFSRLDPIVRIDNRINQLESQFAALWDKWEPYTTSSGVTEEAKEKFKEEMTGIVSDALKEQTLAEQEKEPSLVEKAIGVIRDTVNVVKNTAQNAWTTIKSTVSNLNPFGAGVTQVFPLSTPITNQLDQSSQSSQPNQSSQSSEPAQATSQGANQPRSLTPLAELQEMLDDLAEKIDIFSRQVSELIEAKKQQSEKEIEEDEEEIKELEKKEVVVCSVNINTASKEELQKITGVGPVIAQRIIEARPFSSVYDLKRVSGIGEITLQGIIGQSCAYVVGGTGSGSASASVTYPKILISEIQIEGDNIYNDFIELYNPNDSDADISGYKLRKRTSGGNESSIHVLLSGSIITKKGYYLWASSKDENYPSSVDADTSTTQTLASNNSTALLTPADTIISALAWGSSTNPFVEISPFPDNPGKNQSLGRIWDDEAGEYKDTGDNSADFEIQTPSPKAQNQSLESQPETPPLAVVINEIAWMGTKANTADEWIELYNNSSSTIDLNNWTLAWSRGTSTHSITFSASDAVTTTILGYDFYLMERTDDNTISDISADWFGSFGNGLNNDGEKLELRDADNNLIDLVDCSLGWFSGSSSPDYISMERINPNSTGTVAENWTSNNQQIRNGLDSGSPPNPINGTPKAQNSVYQSLPPEAVTDLAIDSQNSFANKVKLTWSTSTDPDTLSENLSYQIYYLKEALNESNLAQASVASTTATTTLISDLDYSSTYYFGIRAFDGSKYSPLATTTPYRTAALSTIASNFSASDLSTNYLKNNGRKIARASNGDFYVVYSRAGKIFLAESSNQGRNWTEIEATPQEELEQINPSIAIDSQNNLHLVWQGKATTSAPYQIRYRKYDGSSFSTIEDLTNNSEWNQEIPVIVMDSQDNIHIVWVNKQMEEERGSRVWRPKILHRVFTNQWEAVENTGNSQEFSIASLSLVIDSQDNLHLVWQANRYDAPSAIIQYQRRTAGGWGDIRQLDYDDIQADFPSLVIDNQNNLHIVWHSLYNLGEYYRSKINYLKYTALTDSWAVIEILSHTERSQQFVIASPSITLDSQDHLYIIWKRRYEKISQIEYSNSWQEIKNFDLGDQDTFAFTNLLWSYCPIISGKKTNQPNTGHAFIYYQGTELKFYASQDLTWE